MRVLVACEESQRVCIEFRKLGHEAYSCDVIECSGGHPEWHIMQDVLPLINGRCTFNTMDGAEHTIDKTWDMLIAHPPCTHLCARGARWFTEGAKNKMLQDEAARFFMKFIEAECDRIAVENPVGVMSTKFRKPDQIVNPWEFGHMEQKKTCLWLKGIPKLEGTSNVRAEMLNLPKKQRERLHYLSPSPTRSRERSKTFQGIARAMAEQWGGLEE